MHLFNINEEVVFLNIMRTHTRYYFLETAAVIFGSHSKDALMNVDSGLLGSPTRKKNAINFYISHTVYSSKFYMFVVSYKICTLLNQSLMKEERSGW